MTENLDEIIESFKDVFVESTGCETPRFVAHGGSVKEDVALQNIQARSRMVFGYLLA